jgi:beta-1,4-mannosyl-glycoprotein beta-1,4-N-acetylglucosaminyltransferase
MCKKKLIKSPQWIRNLKLKKKYPFYRLDKFYFSKNYTRNFILVDDGGWHFSWVGDLDYVKQKILNTAHQELNITQNLNDNFLEDCINNRKPLMYDGSVYEKINYQSDLLPNFIRNNYDKFKHLIG